MSLASLSLISLFAGVALGSAPAPAGITTPPASATPLVAARAYAAGVTGAPTQFYSVQTTGAPDATSLIGLGLFTDDAGVTSTYYWECMNSPFTVINGYAGCGRDDVYTSCSKNIAFGVDGDMIACTGAGGICATHSIFQDPYATAYTPFVFCATSTKGWSLLQTLSASDTVETTGNVGPPNPGPNGGQRLGAHPNIYIVIALSTCVLALF